MKTAIFINYSANNHSAKEKWLQIKEKVLQLFPEEPIVVPYEAPYNIKDCIRRLIDEEGIQFFVSAGGDGSLNHLLNALIEITGKSSKAFCIGGIGLGSSNDFLKPPAQTIDGIPVKLDYTRKKPADIAKVTFQDNQGSVNSRFFIVNASLGLTAEANILFNQGDSIIRFMKKRSVQLTVLYTAIKALVVHKNKKIRIRNGNGFKNLIISNINLTIAPYISGNLHYEKIISHEAGKMGFFCCGDLTKVGLIKTIWNLSRGKFPNCSKQFSSAVSKIRIESDDVMPLETDGEIQFGKSFHFSVIPNALSLAA